MGDQLSILPDDYSSAIDGQDEQVKHHMKERIADRLKEARNARGLTQSELASKIGCSDSAILRWEQKTNLVPLHRLLQLSNALGESICYFLQDFDKKAEWVESQTGAWSRIKDADRKEIDVRLRDLVELAGDVDIYVSVSPASPGRAGS